MNDLQKLKIVCQDLSILYVEDEDKLRREMFVYLSKFFRQVNTAMNGKEGLKKYQQDRCDMIITDISMPQLNGLDMSQEIKLTNKNQKILIASAYSDSNILLRAIKMGIDGYILKPFDFRQINEAIYKIAIAIEESKQNEIYKNRLLGLVEIKTKEIQALHEEKIKNYKDTLYTLVDLVGQRDAYTEGHSRRVAKYCKLIATALGMSEKDISDIYEAGILHDIGKIAIPDKILLKPGALSDMEYSIMKKHVNIGCEVLSQSPLFEKISQIIKIHHERLDGSGYPDGLKGDDINLSGNIIAVADSFDAMTTNRIYKARKSVSEALSELNSLSGISFDRKVVDCALKVLKDMKIDTQINQMPKSDIEKERFAYFYKDQLTQVYNKSYLDLILNKNRFTSFYKKLHIYYLKNFTLYNKLYSWEKGDEFLKKIASIVSEKHDEDLVFRIQGDDFIVISAKDYECFDDVKQLCAKNSLECRHIVFDIEKDKINSFERLQKLTSL